MSTSKRTGLINARYLDFSGKRYFATYGPVKEGSQCRVCGSCSKKRPFDKMWTFVGLSSEITRSVRCLSLPAVNTIATQHSIST